MPRSAVLTAVIALAVVCADVALVAVWTALAWGLRGSSYEAGRPTAEDELSVVIGWGLVAVAVVIHVVIPLRGALARRWEVPLGVLLGAAATPLAVAAILALLATYTSIYPATLP